MNDIKKIIDKLYKTRLVSDEELTLLLTSCSDENMKYLADKAFSVKIKSYGKGIYIRGLIEYSNFCKNDCLYCGIRRSNQKARRYRLSREEIILCCKYGYENGFRTFVLQGGEDMFYTDDIFCAVIEDIKKLFPDCAVTVSAGERSAESYKRLKAAGADRYLLRHETASFEHYSKLHPAEMSLDTRLECLEILKALGFQTGCGFMVGSPYQTTENIIKDIKFINEFKPHMVGIGPFIPHKDTPFANQKTGSVRLTLIILSIIRLMIPDVLLPATTALGTLDSKGQINGIMHGANVLMPNLSPAYARDKYMLYNNKLNTGIESAEELIKLKKEVEQTGSFIESGRGDSRIL